MLLEFFKKDKEGNLTNHFISSQNIIEKIQNHTPTGNSTYFQLAKSILEIKAIRAQTKAINNNSDKADKLTKIGLLLSFLIIITQIEPIKIYIENLIIKIFT